MHNELVLRISFAFAQSWYLSPSRPLAVVYFFQAGALFCTKNAKFGPISANLGIFVANFFGASIVHPISFHFIENTICSKENYLLLRCIYFILKSFLLWVVPLMSLFLFHDISWSEQSVVILRRPTSFASCWPLCRHFCHLFHLPANLFIAVRLK